MRKQRIFCSTIGLVGALTFAFSGATSAQQATEKKRSFNALIADGFEIKAVTHIVGKDLDDNRTAVTLQKQKSFAVCLFRVSSWDVLSDESLDNPKLCDVR